MKVFRFRDNHSNQSCRKTGSRGGHSRCHTIGPAERSSFRSRLDMIQREVLPGPAVPACSGICASVRLIAEIVVAHHPEPCSGGTVTRHVFQQRKFVPAEILPKADFVTHAVVHCAERCSPTAVECFLELSQCESLQMHSTPNRTRMQCIAI